MLEAIQIEPGILVYYGLSEAIVKKQVENMEKFEKLKVTLLKWSNDIISFLNLLF